MIESPKPPTGTNKTWHRNRFIRDAFYKSLYDNMILDSNIYILGEGSHVKLKFDAPRILTEFGSRSITMPISEDANTNFGVGLALMGITPVVDVITSDFLFRTMDSICNTAAKTNLPVPLIIKAENITWGATAGQRLENLFPRIPDLNVYFPSNPQDMCMITDYILTHKGVHIIFEDREIPDAELTPVDATNIHKQILPSPQPPFSRVLHSGDSITVVSYALTSHRARQVVNKYNLDVDLIDISSLCPLDFSTILNSVTKTHKILVVEPDIAYGGIGSIIANSLLLHQDIQIQDYYCLGAPKITIPNNPEESQHYIPSEEDIEFTIKHMINGDLP